MSITPNPDANFTPTRGHYTDLKPFRFWCQKVLPLVYDDSLSYYELLCKVVDYLNKTMEDVETLEGDITAMYTAFDQLQSYVNTYFDSLDVQREINNKLDAMAASGALLTIIQPSVTSTTEGWLTQHITNPSNPPIDTSLTIAGTAADAKTVGERFSDLNEIVETNTTFDILSIASWQYGTITNEGEATGEQYRNRLRSEFIDTTPYSTVTFSIATGYKYKAFVYDANGTFIGGLFNNAWATVNNTYAFSSDEKYLRVLVADTNDGTVLLDQIRTITISGVYKVGREVVNNENRLNNLAGIYNDVNIGSWFGGFVYASGSIGTAAEFTQYVCTQGFQKFPYRVVINADAGFCFMVRLFNQSKTSVILSTPWLTREYVVPANTPFIINASKTPLENVTDVSIYSNAIHAKSYGVYALSTTPVGLAEEVAKIKEDLITNTTFNLSSTLVWTFGTITDDGTPGGEEYRNRLRCESVDIANYTSAAFNIANGYKYRCYIYNASGVFVKTLFDGWQTGSYTYEFEENEKYLRIVIANTSDTTITLDDIRTLTFTASYKIGAELVETERKILAASGLEDDATVKSWTIGFIYATGAIGSASDFYQYVCTQDIQEFPFPVVITIDNGFQFIVRLYNETRTAVTYSTEWLTTAYYIPANTPFILNASKTTPETVSDITVYSSAIHTKSYALYLLSSPAAKPSLKIAVLGDSISTFANYSEDTGTEYYPRGNVQSVRQTWWYIVAEMLGDTENIAVSAINRTAFYDFGEDLPPVYADARITRLGVNGSPDIVFINAGTNDGFAAQNTNIVYTEDITALNALANSTVKGIALTIRKIQNAYPAAKIVMLIPKQAKLSSMVEGYNLERVTKIADEIKAYAEMYGAWKVIDLRQCGINQTNVAQFCEDGIVHPNAAGMRQMALYIVEQLR